MIVMIHKETGVNDDVPITTPLTNPEGNRRPPCQGQHLGTEQQFVKGAGSAKSQETDGDLWPG